MHTVAKGRRNQNKTRDWFVAQGYKVEVAKFSRWGSTDLFGLWDMICCCAQGVVFVQVKSNRLASPADRRAMYEFEVPEGVRKELWIWYDRTKTPRVIDIRTKILVK